MLGRKSVPAHFWHWNLFVFHWMTTKGNDDHSISSNQEKVTDLWPQLTTRGGWARSNHLKQSEAARPGWKEVMKRGGVENTTKELTGADAALICALIGACSTLNGGMKKTMIKKKTDPPRLHLCCILIWWWCDEIHLPHFQSDIIREVFNHHFLLHRRHHNMRTYCMTLMT